MLQALGLVVHPVPFHAEDFRQHALDQVVPHHRPESYLASGRSEFDPAVGAHGDQTVALQAP